MKVGRSLCSRGQSLRGAVVSVFEVYNTKFFVYLRTASIALCLSLCLSTEAHWSVVRVGAAQAEKDPLRVRTGSYADESLCELDRPRVRRVAVLHRASNVVKPSRDLPQAVAARTLTEAAARQSR